MEIGIALDGEGRLGQPAAVVSVARAADRLGYGSVWCIGPWAAGLVGAVAAVTTRVRIGIEVADPAGDEALAVARAAAGTRLVAVDRLPRWPPGSTVDPSVPTPYRVDVGPGGLDGAIGLLEEAASAGVPEIVVRLVDGSELDAALAAYAVLGELVDGPAPALG